MNNIRWLRLRRQMSQKELAHAAHVTEASISRYENNIRQPTIVTAYKIAKVLGVTIDDLMRG